MTVANVLIVEDEAIVALDLQAHVREMGHAVCGVAESGEQALAIARAVHPDLALMDVRIRGAMDGVHTAAQLMRELQVPVIYLTSYSDAETVQRAARTAPYGYLTKPFQTAELRAGIEVALYKSRMERRLRESERWFASTLRCVQDGILVTEPDGRLRFLNRAAENLIGCAAGEVIGQPLAQLLHYEDGDNSDSAAERALRDGQVVGVLHARRLRTRDGRLERVDESAAPVDDDAGRRLGAVVVLRDASPRLAQEERLRASHERFRSAFDHAPLGMALVSLEGRILQANDALGRLLGDETTRFAGRALQDLAHPDDLEHAQRRLHELMASEPSVVQFEQRLLRQPGNEVVWTLVSVCLLHDEAQPPMCYLYQIHDLTAQRQAAQQLAELAAQRMKAQAAEVAAAARSEFLSRMSHELRTPLNAVLGFAQLLKLQASANQSVQSYTDHILQAGQHLLELVDDVLDIQRATSSQSALDIKRIDVGDSIATAQQMLAPLAAQHQVLFTTSVPAGLSVLADGTRLRQVLLNIGSNAVKYNRPGGMVQWRAGPLPDGTVRISVQDTGVGIPDEALSRLFQPFERLGQERTPIPGTGLGLVIARSQTEAMGGRLSVSSRVGVGTTLQLDLPAAPS